MTQKSRIHKTLKVYTSWNLNKIGLLLACLYFTIPLGSLPPFRWGYYKQVESSLILFWALTGLSSFWIKSLSKKNPRLVELTSHLPLVWGPLFFGSITLLVSPFHPATLRDFVGSPHIGEGIVTFFACGIMAAHFTILARLSRFRKYIFASAFISAFIICSLTILGSAESPFQTWRYWDWAPFFFPDFMGYIDIALICLYLSWRNTHKTRSFLVDALALLFFCLVTYYASNKSLGFGLVIAGLSCFAFRFFPKPWQKPLLFINFFALTLVLTLLISFYDNISDILPESLKSLGHLSTITSRTWLSKITFMDLWHNPLSWEWVQHLMLGKGWGSFNNTAAANMFLIDQISLFSGKDYNPSWEIVQRDLLHTHNIITNYLLSLGIVGVLSYLYVQYKVIHSLSPKSFLLGAFLIIAYQVQVLFWFQFVLTIPFTLLAFSLYFTKPVKTRISLLFKPKWILAYSVCLLVFAGMHSFITLGYQTRLQSSKVQSNTELVTELLKAPYLKIEVPLGAQRQVALARIYANAMKEEFKKSPQKLVDESLKLVNHLKKLPEKGNYLANNVALNILGELATTPETLKLLDDQALMTWEHLAAVHVAIMPYRADILLPFFNLYQSQGKERIVLELTQEILEKNPHDVIALWFSGSSLLKNPAHFNEGMCLLDHALKQKIERFMPVPLALKSKIIDHARFCPTNLK